MCSEWCKWAGIVASGPEHTQAVFGTYRCSKLQKDWVRQNRCANRWGQLLQNWLMFQIITSHCRMWYSSVCTILHFKNVLKKLQKRAGNGVVMDIPHNRQIIKLYGSEVSVLCANSKATKIPTTCFALLQVNEPQFTVHSVLCTNATYKVRKMPMLLTLVNTMRLQASVSPAFSLLLDCSHTPKYVC